MSSLISLIVRPLKNIKIKRYVTTRWIKQNCYENLTPNFAGTTGSDLLHICYKNNKPGLLVKNVLLVTLEYLKYINVNYHFSDTHCRIQAFIVKNSFI